MLSEEQVDAFLARYVKDGKVISVGTNQLGEIFLKKLGMLCEQNKWETPIIPTSSSQVHTAQQFHLPMTNLNEQEVDVAFEFVSQADSDYNFVKRNTYSLVRDKMIAQSAGEVICILPSKEMYEKIHGLVPFEISTFGWKRSLLLLEQIGRVDFAKYEKEPPLSEAGHYLVEAELDDKLTLEEIDTQARHVPGVLETGLFLGMADRLILVGDTEIRVKSRLTYE